MVRVFVEGAKALGVHDDDVDGVTVRRQAFERFRPHPDTLGARIDGRADAEAVTPVKEHAIQQVALACAVHAGDRNDADRTSELRKEYSAFLVDLED